MIKPFLAVCMQPPIRLARNRDDVAENIKLIADMIGLSVFLRRRWPSAWVGGDVRIVAFPEYCFTDWRQIARGEIDPMQVSIEIPGAEAEPLAQAAKENRIFVAAQALELLPEFPGHYFNAMFIFGPDGRLVYKRHKMRHLMLTLYTSPNDILDRYMAVFSKGRSVGETVFPVIESEIGSLGMCVCHEVATPEVARQLAANGAGIIIQPTNEPETYWHHLDRARAIENMVFWVMANSGYSTEMTTVSDYGHSRIVGFRGEMLGESQTGDSTVGAIINVEELRAFKKRPGLPLYSPAVFDYYKKQSIPANMFAKGQPDRKSLEQEYFRLGLLIPEPEQR
jgi:predicted amidohydrolase